MNAPDYLSRLREKTQMKTPMEGTAKTAKTNLCSFCSSPLAHKSLISSATTSYRWLIHFADRNPLEVAFSPAASHAEVLDAYPDALAVEPLEGESWT